MTEILSGVVFAIIAAVSIWLALAGHGLPDEDQDKRTIGRWP